ncbi:diacylglycerol/lipid kinase family protein [Paracoccus beibuensis]|uniref:diacylglycerol/lipid kinase family protein n=1 Tax=Paracoccus beibuensis TaxID=547602 RepID=UPI0022407687|nr:diacylglycerol kinase family protein [Paracoccus beibuensis]
MRALLFHNPAAGSGDHSRKELLAELEAEGIQADYCSSASRAFPECLAKDFDVVVVAGGDGTVCKLVAQMPDRSRPFGIIPLGGSNNVATSLGFGRHSLLSGGWPEAAEQRPFHVGRIRTSSGERIILEGAGFGALATSIDHKKPTPISRREKILNGRRGLATALADIDPVSAEMVVDGQRIRGRWLMAEALTMSHSGPRLPLAPAVGAYDGRFSVVLLGKERRLDMLEWLNAPDEAAPPVQVLSGRNVSFEVDRQILLRIDDHVEEVGGQRIELRIDDDPRHVLLPAAAPKKR